MFVLGGEASRQESPLHARRMQVHDERVEMLRAAHPDTAKLEPLLVRTTILALEAVTRQVTKVARSRRPRLRARKVMVHLVSAGFANAPRAE